MTAVHNSMEAGGPIIGAVANWFGTNRSCAEAVGRALGRCEWVGVAFAGGMSELPYIEARTVAVNDIHRHVVNLARVIADAELRRALIERVRRLPFHPDVLAGCQSRCAAREEQAGGGLFGSGVPAVADLPPSVDWAADYFVCSWMARSSAAGTGGEFNSGLAFRWNSGGGDSAVRYRNAVRSLGAWGRVLARCTFTTIDALEFVRLAVAGERDKKGNLRDEKRGLYLDPPFPDAGLAYKHTFVRFGEMEAELCRAECTRIVVRFYDHPTVRELFPETRWGWTFPAGGKTQANGKAPEALLVRGPSHTEPTR